MKLLNSTTPAQWIALSAMIAVALIAVAVVFTIRSGVAAQPIDSDWPVLTITYETGGASAFVSGEEQTGTEKRRLDYTSKNDWTDTILEAPDIETRVGTFNSAGSYIELSDGVITEYDAIVGATSSTNATEGVSHVAGAAFVRYSIPALQGKGNEFSLVPTNAKVCFESVCEDNATGIRMEHAGQEYVFVNDVRGIPLKRDSLLNVLEVHIGGERRTALSP